MKDRLGTVGWRIVTLGAGALAAFATRQALTLLWAHSSDDPPPDDPADRRTSWWTALTWAMATGVGMGVARLLALRGASAAWQAATHDTPPGYPSLRR